MRVALLVFDGFDLLDVGGPYEVLLTANRMVPAAAEQPFDVVLVGRDLSTVRAYGGMQVTPDATVTDGPFDLVIIPGAIDLDLLTKDDALLDTVASLAEGAQVVSSVCTGSFALAAAGVVGDAQLTTHHMDTAILADFIGDAGRVQTGRRWVDDGRVVTGGGLSSGIAMGLHLVARLVGRDFATEVATRIEYDWDPTGAR